MGGVVTGEGNSGLPRCNRELIKMTAPATKAMAMNVTANIESRMAPITIPMNRINLDFNGKLPF